jgi:hypothetical protein
LGVGEILEPYWLVEEEANNLEILIEQVSPLIGCWGNLIGYQKTNNLAIIIEQVSPLIGCWGNT